MATQGLSLVGFIADQQQAVNYLNLVCVPPDPAPAALLAQWAAAQAQLGPAFANAGHPTISPIPPDHDAHVQALQNAAWLAPIFQQGWELRLVEIEPLLAFQFHVDIDRANAICAGIPNPATVADVIGLCLPANPPTIQYQWTRQQDKSIMITTDDLNIRPGKGGVFFDHIAGIDFPPALPLVQVVQCNGRCYLRNGFHRAYGISQRMVAQIPCLYRDVASFDEVGAEGMGRTLERPLLESANPPTFAHFTQGRSSPVMLRKFGRLIHASWADYVLAQE